MSAPLVEVRGVTKRFGGVTAVDHVDFDIPMGDIVGIIGPNGAGKSTFVNLLTRHDDLDEGTITLDGRSVERLSAHRVARAGLARTYQHNRLFWDDTIRANLQMALIADGDTKGDLAYPGAQSRGAERVEALLDFSGLTDVADELPGNLNHVLQGRVAFAQALALRPRVLLLDEPFAGLTFEEALEFVDLLRRCQEGGLSMVVIDHNMQVVMRVVNHLTVMHHGEVIATGPPAAVQADERVVNVYLKGSL